MFILRAYIGITCHYITDDWVFKSWLLHCERFYGRHDSENIARLISDVVDK